jgi:hypothetical protein
MNNPECQGQPWEQQAGEPNRWYARFELYRLAGPTRSLLGTVNAEREQRGANRSRSVPQAWATNAKRWRWRERAELWDAFERQQTRLAHANDIEEMTRRHLQEARALQSTAIQRLKSLDLDKLSPADVLRFCIEAAKLERTTLGEPEVIAEQRLTGSGGGAVAFTLEDAVRADQELEKWSHERTQSNVNPALPKGDPQVP